MAPMQPMIDPFGRHVTYLRISVTDRCDFRCVYCMAENMTFLPKKEILTLEEIDRVATAFIRRGVRKLRLTGGEPLVRKNLWADRAAVPPPEVGRAGRADPHHQWQPAGALCDRDVPPRGAAHQCVGRYAGPPRFRAITRWGDLGKCSTASRQRARPASRQDEHGGAEEGSMRTRSCRCCNGAMGWAWT